MDETPTAKKQENDPTIQESTPIHSNLGTSQLDHPYTPMILLMSALVITLAGYIPALRYEFVYDDTTQILRNPWLDSWHWKEYFTKHVWAGFSPESHGIYYRPIFLVWARIQVWLFGVVQPPIGWHLSNLLLHMAVVALLFFFVRQLTGRANLAAWTALLFAAHPVHVEPVVWISGSPELLLGFFTLLTLMCYLQYIRCGERLWLSLMTLSFAGALFSKETALVIPALAYFVSRYLESESHGTAHESMHINRRPAWMLACCGAVMILYTYLRVHAVLGTGTGDFTKGTVTMLLTFPSFVWFYVQHLIFPWPVSPVYDTYWLKLSEWWWMLGPLFGAAMFLALLLWRGRRNNISQFAFWFIVLPVLPALFGAISFYRWDMVHDRYLYLSCMGWCLWLALLVEKYADLPERRFMAHASMVTLAALLALYSTRMEPPYRSNIALFEWAVQCAPQNHLARQKLADAYMVAHRYDDGINMFQSYYQPGDFVKEQLMGAALYAAGRYEEAEPFLQRAATSTTVNPALDAVHYNWAVLGMTRYFLNRYKGAELAFRNAITIAPNEKGYHYGMGRTLEAEGRLMEARKYYALEVEISNDMLSRESIERIDTLIKLNYKGTKK